MRPRFDIEPRTMHNSELLLPGLAMLMFTAIVVVIIVLVVWYANHNKSKSAEIIDPLQIAKTRLAKGEITRTEYSDLKKELKND